MPKVHFEEEGTNRLVYKATKIIQDINCNGSPSDEVHKFMVSFIVY